MSRIAKSPVVLPKGVSAQLADQVVEVKGPKGSLTHTIHPDVKVSFEDGSFSFEPADPEGSSALAGTTRSIINNMVLGVSNGFEKKLNLVGVGYRAQMQGGDLNLTLGFSHPVNFKVPEGIQIETPSQTEILVKGADKQAVGQAAANIRAYRPPEPYKGKGVRYANEVISIKEAKKK